MGGFAGVFGLRDEACHRFLPAGAGARIGVDRQQPGLGCGFARRAQLRAAAAIPDQHACASGFRNFHRTIAAAAIGDDDFRDLPAQCR